jgi:hypothetical protein
VAGNQFRKADRVLQLACPTKQAAYLDVIAKAGETLA